MSIPVAEQELYRSCQILFGNELAVGRDFLNYLQPSGLKKAFRLRALQTHPDLAAVPAEDYSNGNLPDFISVREAYENLRGFLNRREQGYRFPASTIHPDGTPAAPFQHQTGQYRQPTGRRTAQPGKRDSEAWSAQTGPDNLYTRLYRGPLPQTRLKLGNFLYYSGLIDWMTIVRALIWQRSQRPRLGELAHRLGWLTAEEIRQVLANREFLDKFGDTAIKNRLLTEQQVSALLGYQKLLQKKFGAYFIENRLLTQTQLDQLIRRQSRHNSTCPAAGVS